LCYLSTWVGGDQEYPEHLAGDQGGLALRPGKVTPACIYQRQGIDITRREEKTMKRHSVVIFLCCLTLIAGAVHAQEGRKLLK